MLLILPEDVRQKLKPLENLPAEVAQEFCRISIEFFKGNVKSKTLRSAENKLSLPEGSVESCVTALLYLLKEAGQREAVELSCLELAVWVNSKSLPGTVEPTCTGPVQGVLVECAIARLQLQSTMGLHTLVGNIHKLSLPEGSVESCVTALLYLLKEAGQRELTEAEFAASIACLRLEPDVRDVLVAYYQGNLDNPALRLRAGDQAPPTERKGQWAYNGLDWRLDLESDWSCFKSTRKPYQD
ncbi:unnamed protein product [Cyprideis torosa]|uniref:Uncharacterized protein n=1 Tax=Cyprideis torosa TaxID=163714 RepID=A0A7R8WN68_9CRUS|nr:unnamed protein product [Cyprideis torosa]CAG0899238.1 unnamed protein product [Cyprideis torosa]